MPVLLDAAIFDGGGSQVVAFVLELTERRRAEAERLKLEDRLRQAAKMDAIGRLASGIAHDFDNMLAAMRKTS